MFALAAVACHDHTPPKPDTPGPCWSLDGTTPGGTVQIGTGDMQFMPLPSELPFLYGNQGGLELVVRSRITGMDPGNATDFLDPKNPKTRFSAIMFDGTVVAPPCSLRYGYTARGDGSYDLVSSGLVEFLPLELGQRAYNTQMTLIVEVIDSAGLYAKNQGDVIVRPPTTGSDAGVD